MIFINAVITLARITLIFKVYHLYALRYFLFIIGLIGTFTIRVLFIGNGAC